MNQSGQDARQWWNFVQAMWYVSVVLVFGSWVVLPMVFAARLRPDYPTVIPVAFLLVAAADVFAAEWLKRGVRARVQSSGIKTVDELIAQISGVWLVITVLPFTPAILGGITYVATGSRSWLTAFAAVGLVALALSRPNLEQYRDIVPGLRLE